MARPQDGLHIYTVHPRNYDEIIEQSANTREPYTRAALEALYAQGLTQNKAVFIMITGPYFWKEKERLKKLTEDEQQMADKLTDAGLEQEEAEAWVRRVADAAWSRGKNSP